MTLLIAVPPVALRIVLADPDALARRGVQDALAAGSGVMTVASAGNARDAIGLVRYHRPDVLLAEGTQPDMPGEELCRRIAREAPGTAVVVLGAVEDPDLAVRCLRAGAAGYLTKDLDPAALPRLLKGVVAGEAAVSRRMAMRLVETLRGVPDSGWRPVRSRLTTREWEIVDLLGDGASTDAIAELLVLSPATVYSHVKNVLAKLGVHSRGEAVPAAMRLRHEEAACAGL
jgi:DNA-binding NarL/FixJ family response regulator